MGARKFVRYEKVVDTIAEAWTHVMAHVDEFTTPNVAIEGELGTWGDDDEPSIKYRVQVYGDVEGGW